jgi:4-hydroxy-2-oxoheptanedioate aldolase
MHSLKRRLGADELLTLIDIKHPCASLGEAVCRLGFDMVFIDCEQGSASFETVEDIARATRAAGKHAIVRPEIGAEHLIHRYLARNVDGIMVPHVDSGRVASELVRQVRRARPTTYEQTLVIAMIESIAAVERLDEILAVDGIDVFFIGAGDLAHSMGLPGQGGHPAVVAAVSDAVVRGRKAGRKMGANLNEANAELLLSSGVTVAYLDLDAVIGRGKRVTDGFLART